MAVEDSVGQTQIRAFIERIERMEAEKAAIAADIKEIYAEAKGNGFDTKILRKVVTIRKQDANERMEQEALLDLYMGALGMIEAPAGYHEERERLNGLAEQIERSQPKAKAEAKPDPVAQFRADPAMHIVDPSTLKSKSEPQPTKAAGSDLTNSQALNGQVAETQPETANEVDEAQKVERRSPKPEDAGSIPAADANAGSSNGRTAAFDAVNAGSTPAPATKYAAPGVVTWETYPPEGVTRSAVSIAFANIGQDAATIRFDLEKGQADPIVKIGKEILDGWARFMTARDMTELDGKPLSYSVVQYDGTDPLIDAIKWNVEGRVLDENQKRQIAATLTRQHPKRKDDIHQAFELWMEPV